MRKNKNIISKNYLEQIPVAAAHIRWSADEKGNVTLEYDNKGVFNRVFQLLFRKPKVSYVHLEGLGNFIWPHIDGEKSIVQIGELVEAAYGEEAHPLYERLARYFQILESYKFIEWKKQS